MEKDIFVKIEEYDDIKDILRLVQGKIGDAKKTLAKIHDLRAKEAEELSRWNEEVEGVENKVNFIVNNIVGIKE